jgi:hypothetical protein
VPNWRATASARCGSRGGAAKQSPGEQIRSGLDRDCVVRREIVIGLAVVPIDHLPLVFEPRHWPFADERPPEIDAHFARRRATSP